MSATSVLACRVCSQAHRDEPVPKRSVLACVRCGATLEQPKRDSVNRTAALALAALILYVPANIFPILRIEQNGARSESTVLGSTRLLWHGGDYVVAIIVFLASIVIPVLKLLGLFYLVVSVWLGTEHSPRWRTRLYRAIDAIGRWAMLDVFVLAVLVSVVKLRGLATVYAGPGVLPFVCVVILTLFASRSFDPTLIWNGKPPTRKENNF